MKSLPECERLAESVYDDVEHGMMVKAAWRIACFCSDGEKEFRARLKEQTDRQIIQEAVLRFITSDVRCCSLQIASDLARWAIQDGIQKDPLVDGEFHPDNPVFAQLKPWQIEILKGLSAKP